MADNSAESVEKVEAALAALFVGNDQFDELEQALDVFCPFEAVGMVSQEVRHAHFLAYVLDPQRPHGFGSECLRAFMAAVARIVRNSAGLLSPLDVHLMGLDGAEIRREWRSIDLVVVVPDVKLVIAIELKIDSGEHGNQLARYRTTVANEWPGESGWRHLFLFLTKTGESASEESGQDWLPIGLENVAKGFAAIVDKHGGAHEAGMMLNAYVSMLRRHHLNDERLDELAVQLWAQHGEALSFLADRRPDLLSKVFAELLADREAFAEQLSTHFHLTFVPEHSSASFLRFGIAEWDSAPGMLAGTGWKNSQRLMVLEMEKRPSAQSLSVRFVMGPGPAMAREALFAALKQQSADVGGAHKLYDQWRRLANSVVLKVTGEEVRSVEEIALAVRTDVTKFLERHLPVYRAAIAGLPALS